MYKRVILTILVFVVLLLVIPTAANAEAIYSNDWAIDYADFCMATNMIPATRETFNPSSYFKRYEVAVALSNAENINWTDSTATGFSDVPAGSVYAAEVRWANVNGIVNGYPDGTFCPNNNLTREEFCVAMHRYLCAFGTKNFLVTSGSTPQFSDYAQIQTWAATPINQLYWTGLITGYDDGSFKPNDLITRAEAASLLMKIHAFAKNDSSSINLFIKDILGEPESSAAVYVYRPKDTDGTMRPYGPIMTNSAGISRTSCQNSQWAFHGINIVYKNMYEVDASLAVPEQKQPTWKYIVVETRSPKETTYFFRPISGYSGITHWPHTWCVDECRNTFTSLCPYNYFYSDRNFGWRYGLNNELEFHPAYDLAYVSGTPVNSAFISGKVHRIGWNYSAGNYLQLLCEHTGAYITYSHLGSINVSQKQYLMPNTTDIARIGNTGDDSNGEHLHFSISRTEALAANNSYEIGNFYDLVEQIH